MDSPLPLRVTSHSSLQSLSRDTLVQMGFLPVTVPDSLGAESVSALVPADSWHAPPLSIGAGEQQPSRAPLAAPADSSPGTGTAGCRIDLLMVGVDARGGEHTVRRFTVR